ncbi:MULTISPECIES: GNAT family N-acetyltransferase [Chryseobacterium]|uniref:GNAT superfamily N-acetyltransferase n=1 Tax=Chryseobacterium camelliae TaxID=1265445 RepID=A0ABU0TD91_9FLAO|nr:MULTISPECIES: GNAT family N-acetyltransferase [Chryseobacterium]MDT3407259.1 GNAT superfamily N-acetyltransferase [Pseudacidovorax intermedius]MDQ1094952.1 GNAT superfamily N-acetyltransferase [Chryseobacterium camelliae]MDQ1098890.1 GNAT superfamily N-acetyltransferase [Chryseobacterium sp. SORGH_AS_1048]MDR6086240.1 GNAT superfamily N-acetyltransferase [Chryseobacterium sp. SORGH_AS_0909]MDR6130610.1 GNAT superfamily N-acetyltransferase [Chryseobacterium sp. SORGH_AS_1175]
MSKVSVVEVKTADQLKKFVHLPMDLYKDNPYYVPSFINDEINIWNAAENPALSYSEARQFLAYRDNNIVGRIAVIINHKEEKELGIRKVRFGWIDFIDDEEVSAALIHTAKEYAKEKGINTIEGPMGFTNLDKAGMLTMGFDRLATMIGIYNHEYYPKHIEKLGLTKEKEWVEFELIFPEVLPEKIVKFNELIAQKYHLKVLRFKNKEEIIRYVDPMFDLLDETYKHLSTYTPISDEQRKTYKEKYFKLIDKDFIVCIADAHDNLVSFAITMPSYSKALQKSKGKLFPFGWWHFLRAGKKNDRANFYLIGIHPDYQRRGVTSMIFKEIFDTFKKKGVRFLETNPELEENKSIQVLWQDYNPVNHKRRRTYSMKIG